MGRVGRNRLELSFRNSRSRHRVLGSVRWSVRATTLPKRPNVAHSLRPKLASTVQRFWGDFLKDPNPELVIKNDANNVHLGRIVVLQLDLLPEKQMLPWQRSFYQKVARTYVLTKSGGIKALPKPK